MTRPPDREELFAGRYALGEELGKGGMGSIYRARDVRTEREVAIKLIRRSLATDRRSIARFQREMRATSKLEHPHTVRVYDFGALEDGQPFLAMELVGGVTLDAEIARCGPLGEARVVHIGSQIARALVAAHHEGIVHRDLKPSNVILLDLYGEPDFVKVLDFGLAAFVGEGSLSDATQLTRPGSILGSARYLSPELASGTPADHRTDFYSLGVLLYEAATGEAPFQADNAAGYLYQHVHEQPIPPAERAPGRVSQKLSDALLRLLEKRPEARPQSAQEVIHLLRGESPQPKVAAPDAQTVLLAPSSTRPDGDEPAGDEPATRICPQCLGRTNERMCPEDGFPTVEASLYESGEGDPLIGKVFDDRYLVEAQLGVGGMGTVYRAVQLAVKRPVALKVIRPELARDLNVVARFQQEARAVASLRHPNTIRLFDFGQAGDRSLFLVMEYLEGEPLADLMEREAPLEPERVIELTSQLLRALVEAHGEGIVHRDLKPENLFVTHVGIEELVKILDFGIAKVLGVGDGGRLTATGVAIGSPRYMSPEQAMAKPTGGPADLYSLGAIAYEMLCRRAPFECQSAHQYLMAHCHEQPPPPSVGNEVLEGPLVDLILSCLAKQPEQRPANAQAALEALLKCRAAPLTRRRRAEEPPTEPDPGSSKSGKTAVLVEDPPDPQVVATDRGADAETVMLATDSSDGPPSPGDELPSAVSTGQAPAEPSPSWNQTDTTARDASAVTQHVERQRPDRRVALYVAAAAALLAVPLIWWVIDASRPATPKQALVELERSVTAPLPVAADAGQVFADVAAPGGGASASPPASPEVAPVSADAVNLTAASDAGHEAQDVGLTSADVGGGEEPILRSDKQDEPVTDAKAAVAPKELPAGDGPPKMCSVTIVPAKSWWLVSVAGGRSTQGRRKISWRCASRPPSVKVHAEGFKERKLRARTLVKKGKAHGTIPVRLTPQAVKDPSEF